ncbi:MAG: YceI family protein [Armatimonadetes bacterium]|nr:YceI family protein [Armatimonadota bacterium]
MNRIQRITLPALLTVLALATAPTIFAAPQTAKPAKEGKENKAQLATGTWSVDKSHTDIGFSVTHLGVSKTRGAFTDFDGVIKADGAKPENSSVSFTIKTASVNTGNTQRDEHLRSKDFFDVATYPEITFKSTKIAKSKNGFVATGNLTMHGVTKTVALPFTVAGPAKGFKGELHMGVDTALTLSRKEYALLWPAPVEASGAVGDAVNITISMEMIK